MLNQPRVPPIHSSLSLSFPHFSSLFSSLRAFASSFLFSAPHGRFRTTPSPPPSANSNSFFTYLHAKQDNATGGRNELQRRKEILFLPWKTSNVFRNSNYRPPLLLYFVRYLGLARASPGDFPFLERERESERSARKHSLLLILIYRMFVVESIVVRGIERNFHNSNRCNNFEACFLFPFHSPWKNG